MGFGHRVYKNYDPRARIIQQHMDEVFEATEYNPLVEIARELEKRALDDEYFTSRKLYPNVDFYSGIIYEALEIPTDMFTVIFAIPRTAGWVAQWMEMKDDPEQKIARPRQIYTGERERDYVRDRRPRRARRKSSGRRRGGRNARGAAPRVGTPALSGSDRLAAACARPDVEADRAARVRGRACRRSTTSTRRWRRCGSGRWRSAPRGRSRPVSLAAGLRARRPGPRAAAAAAAGGCCASRSPGSTCAATATFVPYRGGVGREELDPSGHETPFDLVRETLEAEDDERRRAPRSQGQLRRRASG